jgi:hypothetical protein
MPTARLLRAGVSLLYNDLKVSILEADTANNRLKKQQLISIFANLFVIKHNNPDVAGKAPRFANVNYLRPKDSPFFKTVWRTLLQGIKECAGLDEKSQQCRYGTINRAQKKQAGKIDKKSRTQKTKGR